MIGGGGGSAASATASAPAATLTAAAARAATAGSTAGGRRELGDERAGPQDVAAQVALALRAAPLEEAAGLLGLARA